jgi:hypothetical protein
MLSKTTITLAAAPFIGTASTALAREYVLPGDTDGVNPAFHPHWFPDYPGVDNGPNGDPNAFPPCFDAAGHIYYPTRNACTASEVFASAPPAIQRSAR